MANEERAKTAGKGIWDTEFVPPRDWRRGIMISFTGPTGGPGKFHLTSINSSTGKLGEGTKLRKGDFDSPIKANDHDRGLIVFGLITRSFRARQILTTKLHLVAVLR